MVNAAKTGDVAAQYELGKAYLYGKGVEKNADDALRWLRLAAEHHHAPSQYLLGLVYVLGAEGVKKDPEAGLAYIHQAANAGNLDAQNLLGTIYLKGEAVEKDAATGVAWLERAAQQGSAAAQNSLGFVYRKGELLAQDLQASFRWYLKAAQQADVLAQFTVAEMYYLGEGVQKNHAEAAKWLTPLADKGVQKAQLLLGKICFEGQGVDPDYKRAVLLLHAVAIRGSGEAYYELGRLFEQERASIATKEAIAYYTQALKYQHAAAAQRLEQLSASSPKSAEFAQSMEYMENLNSALKGNVLAQYNVGVFQYLGKGFAQPNYTEAAKWFTMAANQGYAKAQYNLGTCTKTARVWARAWRRR
jgi:TPR repeat protein